MQDSPWQQYRRLRNSLRAATLSSGIAIGAMALVPSILRDYWWLPLPPLAWFFLAGLRLRFWPCPQCHEPFSGLRGGYVSRSECAHCGLAKWADPPPAARGA